MSTSIDERVVQMRFDNKQFEEGAKQSMSTLEKLKAKLNFDGAAKGLTELGKASEQITFDTLGKDVDSVAVKFDALAVVAITALTRITNAAIDTGTQLVKSMSTDQITAGFNKYEQKVQSVQTIMNATGKSIEEVEFELSKLIWFTDETSYSFSDMVDNVGKFTSNQIDLTVATRAMMGIADAAGLAGASTNDASHAMQGFSKAMAEGYMTRQNWTWIQTAHMDTAAFKEQLIEAAEAVGTLQKVSDGVWQTLKGETVTIGNFETGMKDAWLSTDVMLKALERFGGTAEDLFYYVEEHGGLASDAIDAIGGSLDEIGIKAFKASQEAKTFSDAINATKDAVSTGWMETFDILFGNYEEAKELWTGLTEELYDIFAAGAEGRNDVLREWKSAGGRDTLLEGLVEAWTAVKEVIEAVKKAIATVFPINWVQVLKNVSNAVLTFGKSLHLSEDALTTIGELVKALLIPLNVLIQVVRVGWTVFTNIIAILWRLVDVALALPSALGGFQGILEKIFGEERYARLAAAFETIISGLAAAFGALVNAVAGVITGFKGLSGSKIGEAFSRLLDILSPIAEWVLDRIVDGIEAIANFDYSKITDWAAIGLTFVVDRLEDIQTVAGNAIGAIIGFFQQFDKVHPVDFFNNLIQAVLNLKTTIKNTIKGLGVKTITESIKEETSGFTDIIHGLAEALQKLMEKLTPAKILVFGFGVTLTSVLLNVSKAFESFSKISKSISGTFDSVTGIFKAIQDRIKPNKFQKIAAAILLLAGAMVAMSLVNPYKLQQATKSMVVLMAGLTVMVGAFAAIEKFLLKGDDLGKTLREMSVLMLGLAGAVIILAGALMILQGLNVSQVIGPLALVLTTMLGLSMAVSVLAKYTKGELPKNALTLVAFALAIKMVVGALQDLANADLSGIINNIGGLIIAVTLLGTLGLVAGKISFSSGLGMTVLVLDLLLFAKVLEGLGKMRPEPLIQGIMGYMAIMTAMIPLFWLSSLAGKEALKMGVAMLSMVAAIALLKVAVKSIGELSLGEVLKGTLAVSALIAMFAVLTKASLLVGKESGSMGKAFLAMAAAILILGVAIDYIGHIELAAAIQGTAVVSALLAMFALISKMSSNISKATGTVVAMVTAIGILTAAVMLLTLIPLDEAFGAVMVLSTVMLAFGGAMKLINGADWKKSLVSVGMLVALTFSITEIMRALNSMDSDGMLEKTLSFAAMLLALVGAMKILESIEGTPKMSAETIVGVVAVLAAASAIIAILNAITFNEGLLEKVASMSLLMVSIAGVVGVLSLMKTSGSDSIKNAAAFAIVAGVVVGLVAAIGLISAAFDKEGAFADAGVGFLAKLTPLIPIILALAAVTAILSVVGKAVNAAAQGAVGFAKITAILVGVIAGIGAIAYALESLGVDINKVMADAQLVFYAVAEIIGGTVARLITSAGITITEGLITMGENLSTFAEKIKGFLAIKVDPAVVSAVLSLAEVVGIVTAANFLDGISSFLTGKSSLVRFGEQLEEFAPSFKKFADEMDGINAEAVTAAGVAMTGLGDLMGAVVAVNHQMTSEDFSGFAEGLEGFATAIAAYFNTLSTTTITQEQVDATKYATDALLTLANSVPKSGGLLQSFFGSSDIGLFGSQLLRFGEGLRDFFNVISSANIDFELVEACAVAGTALADLANKVPAAGGKLQEFFGAQDIGVFGSQLVRFGEGLRDFFTTISAEGVTIDENLVKACVSAGEAFAQFSEKVPRMGSAFEFFTGSKDMGAFGDQIKKFGEGLADFFTSFKGAGVTEADVSMSKTALEGFSILLDSLGNNGGLKGAWSSADLEKFGEQVKKLGEHLNSYYSSISTIDFDMVNLSITTAQAFLDLEGTLNSSGETIVDAVKRTMEDVIIGAKEILGITGNYSERFRAIAWDVVEGFNRGIDDYAGSASEEAKAWGEEVVSTFSATVGVNSPSVKFAEIAMYVMQGFTNGLQKNLVSVLNVVTNIGNRIVTAFQRFFKIKSPSKLMRDEVGVYIIQGIAEGITDDMSAEEAAAQKAQNIIEAFKSEFDKFSLDLTTIGLEFDLWSARNPNASESAVNEQNIKATTAKLQAQAERVNLANAQYQATLQALGEQAEETQEAWNTYLQEQTTMYQYAKELADLQKDSLSTTSKFDTTTMELELELWEKTTDVVDEAARTQKEIDIVTKQLEGQAVQVVRAENVYKELVASLGPEADATVAAYQEFLSLQIQMADLAQDLVDLNKGESDDVTSQMEDDGRTQRQKFQAFVDNINEMYDSLKTLGFSDDEIKAWAAEQSGWYPEQAVAEIQNEGEDTVKGIINSFLQSVDTSLVEVSKTTSNDVEEIVAGFLSSATTAIDEATGGLEFVFTEPVVAAIDNATSVGGAAASSGGGSIGSAMGEGLASGIDMSLPETEASLMDVMEVLTEEGIDTADIMGELTSGSFIDKVNERIRNCGDTLVEAIRYAFKWATGLVAPGIGQNIALGMANGMKSPTASSSVKNAASYMAGVAEQAAMKRLDENSPSKVFYKIGQYIDQGLANGILDDYSIVAGSISKMTQRLIDDSDFGIEPVISPVLDGNSLDEMRQRMNDFYGTVLQWDPTGKLVPYGFDDSSFGEGSKWLKIDRASAQVLRFAEYDNELTPGQQAVLDALYNMANTGKINVTDDWESNGGKGEIDLVNGVNNNIFNYNQTIQSPKAINAAEVARQANNALGRMKRSADRVIHGNETRLKGGD